MSETKHTPGPYRNVDGVIYCGELVIARMCIDRGPRTGDLLAAAPELLDALEHIADELAAEASGIKNPALINFAVKLLDGALPAIAKAKGESK
jgi:hypothetical protein